MRQVFTFAAILLVTVQGAISSQSSRPMALVGATIYANPTDAPIRDGVVLIRDGTIAAVGSRISILVPKGAEVLDCAGRTIMAGFWNSHVHFMERKWANVEKIPAAELTDQVQTMLTRYGFTSVFDTGSSWDNTRRLRNRIESGEITGPRIRATGEILVPKGGVPADLVFDITGAMRMKIPEIADDVEATSAAKALLDGGVDGIKVYAATWAPPIVALPEGAIRAVVEEAHRRGKPVFAHPSNRNGLMAAVNGGVDVIVHTAPQAGPWDESIIAAMKKARVALIPTLKLWMYEFRHDRTSSAKRFAGVGSSQLRAWLDSGGEVLFGTDVGYMNDYDPSDEYTLMAQAGMSFRQILASMTTVPALRFGDSHRLGRIASGLSADLVVLSTDPAENVRAFGDVRSTIRDGKIIFGN
jgi:imidazolonepropionase-like amidohydrolase